MLRIIFSDLIVIQMWNCQNSFRIWGWKEIYLLLGESCYNDAQMQRSPIIMSETIHKEVPTAKQVVIKICPCPGSRRNPALPRPVTLFLCYRARPKSARNLPEISPSTRQNEQCFPESVCQEAMRMWMRMRIRRNPRCIPKLSEYVEAMRAASSHAFPSVCAKCQPRTINIRIRPEA